MAKGTAGGGSSCWEKSAAIDRAALRHNSSLLIGRELGRYFNILPSSILWNSILRLFESCLRPARSDRPLGAGRMSNRPRSTRQDVFFDLQASRPSGRKKPPAETTSAGYFGIHPLPRADPETAPSLFLKFLISRRGPPSELQFPGWLYFSGFSTRHELSVDIYFVFNSNLKLSVKVKFKILNLKLNLKSNSILKNERKIRSVIWYGKNCLSFNRHILRAAIHFLSDQDFIVFWLSGPV